VTLDVHYLFASLMWGSAGVGYCIYGRRQESIAPFIAGVLMIAASYFISSAIWMSLSCLGLLAGAYVLAKRGY
jgi:hypothetical protein